MSLEAMVAGLYLPNTVDATHRFVCVAIGNYADENDEAYPSVSTIAQHVNLSERRVQAIMRNLAETGYLERTIQGSFDLRIPESKRTNLYRLTFVPPGLRRVSSTSPGVAHDTQSIGNQRAYETVDNRGLGDVHDTPPRPRLVARCSTCGQLDLDCRCAA